jgi:predicted aconitase with swiveling domain
MMELILNDLAPFAVVLRDVDSILCTGAIIAEEFFGEELDLLTSPLDAAAVAAKTTLYDYDENESGNANRSRKRKLPIIVAVGGANFARLHGHSSLSIHDDDERTVCITSGDLTIRTPNLLKLPNTLSWGEYDDPTKFTLSPAEIVAKRTISRIASVSSSLPPSATAVSSGGSATTTTTSVIPITSAHIDAVTYIGQGGLKFVQKLVESGARVKVT